MKSGKIDMKEKMQKLKLQGEYLMIILGALMASFSVACILLPNDAIDYGTAGISIMISMVTGWELSLCVILFMIPFLAIGFVFLGKRFFLKATVGSVFYTVGLELFEEMPFVLNTEHFIAVAFGGAILGAGLSMILRAGGCIDGSEILANIIVRKASAKTGRNYSLTFILIVFNAIVYATAFVVIDRNGALLSLLVYVVATAVIDHFTDHFEAIKQVTIITANPAPIVADIKEKMHKTCTIFDSKGAIAGKNSTLICYVNYFELQAIRDILGKHGGSFSTVNSIEEVIH